MNTAAYDCDVLVIGLGPIGAALTALLATRDVATIAIDAELSPYPMPRAVHFDHEIMRIFQEIGITEQILDHAAPADRYEFRNGSGELLIAFDPIPMAPCGWASGYMFHQPGLEQTLRDRLTTLPKADVRLGWRFESFTQDEEGVTANLTSPDGPVTIRARYLVGCDGAKSRVRQAIGAELSDYAFDEPWLVIDVKLLPGARLPDVNLQICDPKRPTSCVHSGPGRHRWEFMMLPGETADQVLADDFIQALLAPWDCGPIEIERRAVYRFHGLVAKRWRLGRVMLAGDSAHQTPPFAGQGMCAGMRDAANLAWKLDAMLGGHADDALLDSYQAEREPNVRTIIEFAIGMGRVICTLDEETATARDRDMLARKATGAPLLPSPRAAPFKTGCVLAGNPSAGEIFPQPTSGQTRLDDVLGQEAWLISREPVSAPGITARHLGEEILAPFRPALATWLDKRKVDAVLVRPDRYIFGSGEPQALLEAWQHAAGQTPHTA
jgi:3-(3-hydroxy-phenyl)propionate hydroxylase